MKTSNLLPSDRPSRVYCMVCEKYLAEDVRWGKQSILPEDISKHRCYCGALGSMVYVFNDKPSTIPPLPISDLQKFPHCGDPNCKGYCDDLACIPQTRPSEPENNSTTKENAIAASIVILFIALAVMHKLGSI